MTRTWKDPDSITREITGQVMARSRGSGRQIVAISGPPASGKSTTAAAVVEALNGAGHGAQLMAMDGFHLDNTVLDARGLLARKGAPETFDLAGFASAMERIACGEEVILPTFDRALDKAIAGCAVVPAGQGTLVVEGNYLHLNEPGWRALSKYWTYSVHLDVAADVLRARLVDRWLTHGHTPEQALARAEANDMPNAARVSAHRMAVDLVI